MPQAVPVIEGEQDRLARLRALVVLDSAPEQVFDTIAHMASEICGTPIALLSLVDEERQWFKANVGLPGLTETPRDVSFCTHALGSDDLLHVPDATLDARFADNPAVTAGLMIRFYAGAPLVMPDEDTATGSATARMGTLCVMDHQARALTAVQQRTLQMLADIATQALVMRRDLVDRTLRVAARHEAALRVQQAFLQRIGHVAGVGGWQLDLASGAVTWSEETYRIHEVGLDYQPNLGSGIGFYAPEAQPVIAQAVQHGMASGQGWDLELPFITATGRHRWVRAQGEVEQEDGQPVRLVGAFQDITERRAAEQRLRELTTIIEHTPDFVVQTDARGVVNYMNPAVRQALDIGADAPLGRRHFRDFNTDATNALFAREIQPTLASRGAWLGDTTVQLAGGRELQVSHLVIAHRNAGGQAERYSAVMRDISAEVGAKRELQQQRGVLSLVAEAIPARVAVVGSDGRLRFVNGAFERWFGTSRERVLGQPLQDVLGCAQYECNRPFIERALAGEAVQFEKDDPGPTPGRHVSLSYTPLWRDGGADGSVVDGFVSVAQDISHHKQEQGRLRQLSESDALTGLLNRAGFESWLEDQTVQGHGASLALLYLDLDRFKPVNDQHGHATGDRVLQAFALRLRQLVRPTDAVARLGGDEFAVALAQVRSGANAHRVADKVLAAAHTPFDIDGLQLQIGASVGVAFGAQDSSDGWRALIARADALLYRAKASGRGRQAGESGAAREATDGVVDADAAPVITG